jgi:hypothetical protein
LRSTVTISSCVWPRTHALPVCLSVCLSACPPACLFVRLPVCLSVCMCSCLPVCVCYPALSLS